MSKIYNLLVDAENEVNNLLVLPVESEAWQEHFDDKIAKWGEEGANDTSALGQELARVEYRTKDEGVVRSTWIDYGLGVLIVREQDDSEPEFYYTEL